MYWTKTPGTGGQILSEDDFIVEEIPLKKFFVKYSREAGGVSLVKGPYTVYRLQKKGVTTKDALSMVAKTSGISVKEIGYAGLKDKFAVTTQYITLRKEVPDVSTEKLHLTKLHRCSNMMQVGELEGNKFVITLHGCAKPENAPKALDEIQKRGMPNYFGPQRFGTHGNNHDIGLLLLQREYGKALDLISKNSQKHSLIDRKTLKFFVNAYQSSIFNEALDACIAKNKEPFFGDFPVPGFATKFGNEFASVVTEKILARDGISLKDFEFKDLLLKCSGSQRPAFVRIKSVSYKVEKNNVTIAFELPRGSYATVLIKEVTK